MLRAFLIEPMPIPLLIADVAIRVRSVPAPEKCPKCGTAIITADGIKLLPIWTAARITATSDDISHDPRRTELHPVEWRCYECDAVIAGGTFHYTYKD